MICLNNDEYYDFCGFVGWVVGGVFKVGDEVLVFFFGFIFKIKLFYGFDGEVLEVFLLMFVVMMLIDEIDILCGGMIVKLNN